MKKILSAIIMLLGIVSCASIERYETVGAQAVKFKHGKIIVKPLSSVAVSPNRELLSVKLEITNSSKKVINFNAYDAILITPDNQTISVLEDAQIKSIADQRGAYTTSLVSGAYANPSYAQNAAYQSMTEGLLKSGRIIPNGKVSGFIYFKVPKNAKMNFEIRFFDSLKSNGVANFNEGSKRSVASSENSLTSDSEISFTND